MMTIRFGKKTIDTFTYNIFPPPNSDKNIVVELVPMPSVRSTNNAVYSPYTIFVIGRVIDLSIVTRMPITISVISHFVANRYCNFEQENSWV